MAAVRNAIEQALLAILRSVKFDGIDAANIRVSELPDGDAIIAPLPSLLICPYGKNRNEELGFESASVDRVYTVQLVFVDATQGEFAKDQARYEGWPEAAIAVLNKDPATGQWRDTLSAVPSVWAIRVLDDETFDRTKLSQLYSYQSVLVEFHSSE